MWKTIFVIAEGQTETNFVNKVLAPYFLTKGKILIPCTIVTSTDRKNGRVHKGGISNYKKIHSNLLPNLKNALKSSDKFVTTMIDFYGLPTDTPGYEKSSSFADPYQKIAFIENEMLAVEKLEKPIFVPYIQLHEFEALLFCDVEKIKNEYCLEHYDFSELEECVRQIENPELINNGSETAPSKRIINCIETYDKATAGVNIAKEIGLDVLRQKCTHFDDWLNKLEEL